MSPSTVASFDQLEAEIWEDMYAIYLGDPEAYKIALGIMISEFVRCGPEGGPLSRNALARLGAMAVGAKLIEWEAKQ